MSTLASVILEGAYASIPSASIPGRLYFTTDTNAVYRDNGTSWDDVTPSGSSYTLPGATSSALGGIELASGQTSTTLATVATTGAYSDLSGTPSGLPPSGTAGGDLSGTFPNPVVAQVNGAALPDSAPLLATNSSGQIVAASTVTIAEGGTGATTATAACIALGAVPSSTVGVASGVAGLDGSGHVPVAQLPSLVMGSVYSESSQAAMLALSANQGDCCVRTDISETFILASEPASTLGNWVEILTPPGVTSVGLSMPAEFSVSSSPVTTTGTLSVSKATQTANSVYAGPSSGSSAQPTFRALVAADIPAVSPSGTAGGDLSGAYPSPTVTGLNGTSLSGLATGLLKNTTGTGVPTIAVAGTDYAGIASANVFSANQTLAPTTAATSGANQSSPILFFTNNTWNGSASVQDTFTIQNIPNSGSNATGVLVFGHIAGSSESSALRFNSTIANVQFQAPVNINAPLSATSSNNYTSPTLVILGQFWNGSASTTDSWNISNALGSGTNPNAALSFTHSLNSSPGTASVTFQNNAAAATSTTVSNAPILNFTGNYWNGSASANDTWSLTPSVGTGTNGAATLTLAHSGSSGGANLVIPTNVSFSGNNVVAAYGTLKNQPNLSATSVTNYANSGIQSQGNYWNGSASTPDIWQAQTVLGTGTTPTTTLNLTHASGSTGVATVALPHLGGNTSIPTVAAGTGAGTSPTVSMQTGSTDLSGWVNVTTGTSPTGSNATIVTVTFNAAYGLPAKVVLTPANAAAAALNGATQVFVPIPGNDTTFIIESGSTALAASTAYVWAYTVTQ